MKFTLNRPVAVSTPTVVVDAGLKIGVSRFQLVVVDQAGNRSKPAHVDVVVQRAAIPPIVIDPVIVNPIPIPIDPRRDIVTPPNRPT